MNARTSLVRSRTPRHWFAMSLLGTLMCACGPKPASSGGAAEPGAEPATEPASAGKSASAGGQGFMSEQPEVASQYSTVEALAQAEMWFAAIDPTTHCSYIEVPGEIPALAAELDTVIGPLGYAPEADVQDGEGIRRKSDTDAFHVYGIPREGVPPVFSVKGCFAHGDDAATDMMALARWHPDFADGLRFAEENGLPVDEVVLEWTADKGLYASIGGDWGEADRDVLTAWLTSANLWDASADDTWEGEFQGRKARAALLVFPESKEWIISVMSPPGTPNPWR